MACSAHESLFEACLPTRQIWRGGPPGPAVALGGIVGWIIPSPRNRVVLLEVCDRQLDAAMAAGEIAEILDEDQ